MKSVLQEIFVFWALMLAGRYTDLLMSYVSNPEDESNMRTLLIVNLQIALVVSVAILVTKYVPQLAKRVPGSGILYAFAFLQTQDSFKKRTSKVAKLI